VLCDLNLYRIIVDQIQINNSTVSKISKTIFPDITLSLIPQLRKCESRDKKSLSSWRNVSDVFII